MNDWVPKQHKWVTSGYNEYRKRCKKKHSKDLFEKHVKRSFKAREIDINMVSSAPYLFMELFWQIETLKDWSFDLTCLLARQGVEQHTSRLKQLEMLEELKTLAQRAAQIFRED